MGAVYSACEKLTGRFRGACARILSVMMFDPSTYRVRRVYVCKYSSAPEKYYCCRCEETMPKCECRAA